MVWRLIFGDCHILYKPASETASPILTEKPCLWKASDASPNKSSTISPRMPGNTAVHLACFVGVGGGRVALTVHPYQVSRVASKKTATATGILIPFV